MIDLEKLTPAPWGWISENGDNIGHPSRLLAVGMAGVLCCDRKPNPTDAAFIALARNAFDVMMRRGWGVSQWDVSVLGGPPGWYAIEERDGNICAPKLDPMPDPFTALVEADKWYTENVENRAALRANE